jgi:two-component system CheB/CheR fusion protein
VSVPEQDELEALLEHIRTTRGVDFSGYKRTTLSRRIRKRMADVGVSRFEDYADLLEAHADEFNALFSTILINVTTFFRDRPAWDYVAERLIPSLLESQGRGQPIRVWSAGCASGEEPYSVAMLFAEVVGMEDLRKVVKIYATDVDEEALAEARQGSYSPKDVAEVPEALRDRYFDTAGTRLMLRNELRRAVIFGRHDLTADAPISRLDLLVCRNTLMYFNAETQHQILRRFHFALEDRGSLFLGKAEMLLSHGGLFLPVSMKNRIFRKTASLWPRGPVEPPAEVDPERTLMTRHSRLRDLAIDAAPVALIAVDIDGIVVAANSAARGLFGMSSKDLGQPLQNLEVSYRPLELRSRLEQIYSERRPVTVRSVERVFADGETQYLDVTLAPVLAPDESLAGAAISFADVTAVQRLHDELQRSREDLETTYEELRSTNEELETTNEELQSSNEELETTNEELQSSNEELETMNEELRSTNEELETANDELRVRAQEMEGLNGRLESLVASMVSAVVVVDRELVVELWNHAAEALWALPAPAVEGRSLLGHNLGLPMGEVEPAIRACLDGRSIPEVVTVRGLTRTGQPTNYRVTCTPVTRGPSGPGAVLMIEAFDG